MSKRKSAVKQMINEALAKVDGSGFPEDPEFDASEVSGPERFAKGQKAKDEVIIDSQLADIAGQEGYFLKLKKELRPGLGEWMLMKTIESEWRRWADIETEVARIVKEHTKSAPAKWGSGPYRIEYACKGGMRGKTYPPKDFYINAEEEFLNQNTVNAANATAQVLDPATQVTTQLDMLARLMDVVRGAQPAPMDPAKTQEQIAGAFEKGLTIKASEGNNQTQMMTAMMTGLMGMMTAIATNRPVEPKVVNPSDGMKEMLETLKTFGVLGTQEKEKPKDLIATLTELKAIGVDIFKKDDPMEQIGKLKQFAGIAADLMGMGGTADRPSIFEKLVDMVGPAIPGMVKEIADASKNAVQVQVEAGRNIERARIATQSVQAGQPTQTQPSNEGTSMHTQAAVDVQTQQVQAFFNGLYESVQANNRMYYPIVYTSLLQDPKGAELLNGIVQGTQTAKELIDLLQSYGDARFKDSEFVMKRLVSYVNGFIVWLRDMMKPKAYAEAAIEVPPSSGFVPPKGPGVDAECMICRTVYVYETKEEFEQEESKTCGNNGCIGSLRLLTKAS